MRLCSGFPKLQFSFFSPFYTSTMLLLPLFMWDQLLKSKKTLIVSLTVTVSLESLITIFISLEKYYYRTFILQTPIWPSKPDLLVYSYTAAWSC